MPDELEAPPLLFLKLPLRLDVRELPRLGDAREAVAFCTQLKGDARLARVPVIGIVAAGGIGIVCDSVEDLERIQL